MPPSTYVARRPGPFAALIQAADVGGFRLDPLAPVRVRDQYWDTADGELLRSGLALRVREAGGERTAALRPLSGDSADRLPDAVLGPGDAGQAPDALRLPPGPLADAVAARLGTDVLRPLLAFRQYRTPRIAYDGARPALLVSLDVVVYEVPGAQVVSNEVEVEATAQGGPADLHRLDPALRLYSLEPESRTKLERGLLRLPRDLADPVLLLPDERAALERYAAHGDPLVRRRARVLLLDARGYRADTVAGQTGVSAARVRHWKERFRESRMGIFEAEPDAAPSLASRAPERADAPTHVPAEAADAPAGDGSAPDGGGIDDLLDLFTPGDPDTPLLDDDDGAGEGWDAERDDLDEPQHAAPDAAPGAEPSGPPRLTADTPLVSAALATLAYHVDRFESAAAGLEAEGTAEAGTAEAARRLLRAVHRVRLAVEAFAPFVPAMAAGRLVGALRPLVAALDRVLDHDRAALFAERDRALDAVRALLRGGRHRAWGPRARRLIDRLDAQHAAGLLIGDDFPAPPDDLVGQPGDVPAPSRLRHAAASMLWARFEAVRAFEDEVAAAPTPETAAHLALAIAGFRFVLALAANASAAPAATLSARLDAAEARVAAAYDQLRTAELVARAGGPPLAGELGTAVADVWAELTSEEVRREVADVAAGI